MTAAGLTYTQTVNTLIISKEICSVFFGSRCYTQTLFSISSDEEDKSSLYGQTEVDGTEVDGSDKPAESRIRNL